MIAIMRLAQINVAKHFYHGLSALPKKNSPLLNTIRRMSMRKRLVLSDNISPKTIKKFKTTDKLPDDFVLIYQSPISKIATIAYHSSYIIMLVSLFGIYYVETYQKAPASSMDKRTSSINRDLQIDPEEERLTFDNIAPMNKNDVRLMLSSMILMNACVFWISRLHVIRIWFSPKKKEYLLYLIGNMPLLRKTITLPLGTPVVRKARPLTAFGRTSHYINGKKYRINESNFQTPADYHQLVGQTLPQ